MKREILFRGFHPDENGPEEITLNGQKIRGRWVEGWYCGKTCDTPFSKARESAQILDSELLWYEVIPETVGEYIGIDDKNGSKMFEDDIVKHRSEYSGNFIVSIVTYTDGCFLAMADNNSGFGLSNKFEVIGNIFSNPELTEVQDDD